MNIENLPYDCTCSKSELELFTAPPVNVSMEKGDTISHQPIAALTDNAPIEFHISASSEEYIDLGRTELYVKLKVTNVDGTNLAQGTHAAPVNLSLHSLFSQVNSFIRLFGNV